MTNDKHTFDAADLSVVYDFVQQSKTSVLTTMFTDIKGFTEVNERRGDIYASKLRAVHDKLLVDIIQAKQLGLVIKFIGDSVMAVFAEPSIAVERAMNIQRAIAKFNQETTEFEPISVRIGLHMGQVAVEGAVQLDVFGRHVNRAARVESLADGGQVFMSYPVFDSARTWIEDQTDVDWTLHGEYELKGIDHAIAIYEVNDAALRAPHPPLNGRKKRSLPKLVTSLGLVALGLLLAAGAYQYQATETWLVKFYPDELYLDGTELVLLEAGADKDRRRILNDLDSGPHLFHFDLALGVRMYAEVDVKRGQNQLQPNYKRAALPAIRSRAEKIRPEQQKSIQIDYFLYDSTRQRKDYHVDINLKTGALSNAEEKLYQVAYEVVLNGQSVAKAVLDDWQNPDPLSSRSPEETLWEDEYHRYVIRYYVNKSVFEVNIEGQFKLPVK